MSTPDSDSELVAKLLVTELLRLRPHLSSHDLRRDASLTQDLGLDSLDLEQLFCFIRAEIAEVDLTPWFLSAARRGSDSLESLAQFLASATKLAA